jgi:exodeoxyribonuclease VII small subunit
VTLNSASYGTAVLVDVPKHPQPAQFAFQAAPVFYSQYPEPIRSGALALCYTAEIRKFSIVTRMPPKKVSSSFASTLTELEALANRLEDNDTPLEQSLQDFEKGVQLIRHAQKSLLEAEQKVQLLLEKNGAPVTAPLDKIVEGEGGE